MELVSMKVSVSRGNKNGTKQVRIYQCISELFQSLADIYTSLIHLVKQMGFIK